MGDPRGFLKFKRRPPEFRPVGERIMDRREVCTLKDGECSQEQAARCMDCGTPFCHWGCPVGNYIPEWNDLVFREQWVKAAELLSATNNLPEITGRICPAPCEYACVLGINDDPVTIRENELSIIETAFREGYIKPIMPKHRTDKRVAVIGSGPAGLACAAQLNKAGHNVVVFEKDDKAGGILRYGIPDFKLEKWVVDRRIMILEKEGVKFATSVNAGVNIKASKLKSEFDAICLAGGSRVPRDLNIEGRDLKGICFAMDYLVRFNKKTSGDSGSLTDDLDAKGKKVVVIGGGDTGADCIGVAHRQGARDVVQIELLPKPALCRTPDYPWPSYPLTLRTSSSHEEGGGRHWAISTKKFIGEEGCVRKLSCVKVEFMDTMKDGRRCPVMKEMPGTEFVIDADLVMLAMGFLRPEKKGLLEGIGVEFDNRGNVRTAPDFMTSVKGVFSAGDMRRGQSLIVWAIAEGRRAAHHIDKYLMGRSYLPFT